MSNVDRAKRLAASARNELAALFQRRQLRELKAPCFEAAPFSISEVSVEGGNQHVRVFVSFLYGEPAAQEAVLAALADANATLRGELGRRLRLRAAPTLSFHLDDSLKRGARVLALLDELNS